MKILDVKQGTPEWLNERAMRVGASDVAILMTGTDRQIASLYNDKMLGSSFENEAMARGKRLEPDARSFLESMFECSLQNLVGVHDEHDFLIASFDGINLEKGLQVEIKCPYSDFPESVKKAKNYLQYYWQVQAQLAVSGLCECVLCIYSENKQLTDVIARSEEDISLLIKQAKWFYEHLQTQTSPFQKMNVFDPHVVELAEYGKKVDAQLKYWEQEKKKVREKAIEVGGGIPYTCEGMELTEIPESSYIDYKKVVETFVDPDTDLSAFQKTRSSTWRISFK